MNASLRKLCPKRLISGDASVRVAKHCALGLTLLAGASLPAAAQRPPAGLPGPGNRAAARATVPVISPDSSNGSRFLTEDELDGYVAETSKSLSIMGRQFDPFGQVQDPAAKPAVIKPKLRDPSVAARRSSFDEIIGKIKINTIMPSEKRFLVGTRSFKLGDKFPISYRGRNTLVEVVDVKASKIEFKNTESGEISSVKIKLLPAGMSSGDDGGFSAPGMVKDKDDAPLQLEPFSSPGF